MKLMLFFRPPVTKNCLGLSYFAIRLQNSFCVHTQRLFWQYYSAGVFSHQNNYGAYFFNALANILPNEFQFIIFSLGHFYVCLGLKLLAGIAADFVLGLLHVFQQPTNEPLNKTSLFSEI